MSTKRISLSSRYKLFFMSEHTLVFHMHTDKTTRKRLAVKAIRFLLLLNSVSVFVMLGFSLFILTSQYHNLVFRK